MGNAIAFENRCKEEIHYERDDQIAFQERKLIGKKGGFIDVVETFVKVTIPENAIEGVQQEIEIKTIICQPNDWSQLESEGYTIDLPIVQMSPSGTKFIKPVEITTEIDSLKDEGEIECEFAYGDINSNTIWQKAIRASSKKEAERLAVSEEPHVSFWLESLYMHAYTMHFSKVRKILKGASKSKCLGSSVYCDRKNFRNGSLTLGVFFYRRTKMGLKVCINRRLIELQNNWSTVLYLEVVPDTYVS